MFGVAYGRVNVRRWNVVCMCWTSVAMCKWACVHVWVYTNTLNIHMICIFSCRLILLTTTQSWSVRLGLIKVPRTTFFLFAYFQIVLGDFNVTMKINEILHIWSQWCCIYVRRVFVYVYVQAFACVCCTHQQTHFVYGRMLTRFLSKCEYSENENGNVQFLKRQISTRAHIHSQLNHTRYFNNFFFISTFVF